MNRQRVAVRIVILLLMLLTMGMAGCGNEELPKDTAEATPAEKPVPEADLTARLQEEINETQTAISEAVELQGKLATEIEVLQQLLEETETELAAHEEEVSRLEAKQKR